MNDVCQEKGGVFKRYLAAIPSSLLVLDKQRLLNRKWSDGKYKHPVAIKVTFTEENRTEKLSNPR